VYDHLFTPAATRRRGAGGYRAVDAEGEVPGGAGMAGRLDAPRWATGIALPDDSVAGSEQLRMWANFDYLADDLMAEIEPPGMAHGGQRDRRVGEQLDCGEVAL
jgi:hypothetical protein